jgi:hypothetical protein
MPFPEDDLAQVPHHDEGDPPVCEPSRDASSSPPNLSGVRSATSQISAYMMTGLSSALHRKVMVCSPSNSRENSPPGYSPPKPHLRASASRTVEKYMVVLLW